MKPLQVQDARKFEGVNVRLSSLTEQPNVRSSVGKLGQQANVRTRVRLRVSHLFQSIAISPVPREAPTSARSPSRHRLLQAPDHCLLLPAPQESPPPTRPSASSSPSDFLHKLAGSPGQVPRSISPTLTPPSQFCPGELRPAQPS